MHGLIFKIKESHRQDQSESFVIYICAYTNNCICFLYFHNKSNEITSLWPVLCVYIYMIYICVVSSRRNKTNPHHRNKFIPVLHTTHLQAFKPKLSTYDQLLKIDQQNVSLYICVCVSWNIFNRIHFFAICDVVLFAICSFLCDIYIWW
jgi:hypothetical protein